jgi:subtilisin family serine protease
MRLPPEDLKEGEPLRTIGWNIQKIMADSCWHRGYTGNGVIIGMLDSGIDTTHSALRGGKLIKWCDFQYNSPIPYDDELGLGTGCAGIICGGDGLGPFENDIGVAPGAKLIVGRIVSSVDPLLGLQWIASLKADSGFNIKGVNNSWGGSNTIYFWDVCNTLKSLDILPIFAIGNSGPNPHFTGSPGNYPLCIGVGATNCFDSIAIFSSRGPAPDSSPWNNPQYWYRPDWNLIKPDIVAPGVSVLTSQTGNSYVRLNGTSYSTTHITGAVAILCEADSSLNPTSLFNLILENADRPSHGGPYPNNNYGWGRLNVYKALQNVLMINENKQVSIARPLMIKPNPNRGRIYFNEKFGDCIIKLYDATGRLVMEERFTGINDINIPESAKNGVYFLRIKMPEEEKTGTFILIR